MTNAIQPAGGSSFASLLGANSSRSGSDATNAALTTPSFDSIISSEDAGLYSGPTVHDLSVGDTAKNVVSDAAQSVGQQAGQTVAEKAVTKVGERVAEHVGEQVAVKAAGAAVAEIPEIGPVLDVALQVGQGIADAVQDPKSFLKQRVPILNEVAAVEDPGKFALQSVLKAVPIFGSALAPLANLLHHKDSFDFAHDAQTGAKGEEKHTSWRDGHEHDIAKDHQRILDDSKKGDQRAVLNDWKSVDHDKKRVEGDNEALGRDAQNIYTDCEKVEDEVRKESEDVKNKQNRHDDKGAKKAQDKLNNSLQTYQQNAGSNKYASTAIQNAINAGLAEGNAGLNKNTFFQHNGGQYGHIDPYRESLRQIAQDEHVDFSAVGGLSNSDLDRTPAVEHARAQELGTKQNSKNKKNQPHTNKASDRAVKPDVRKGGFLHRP